MAVERLHVILELTEEKIRYFDHGDEDPFNWAINALHDLRIRVPRDDTFDRLANGHLQFSWSARPPRRPLTEDARYDLRIACEDAMDLSPKRMESWGIRAIHYTEFGPLSPAFRCTACKLSYKNMGIHTRKVMDHHARSKRARDSEPSAQAAPKRARRSRSPTVPLSQRITSPTPTALDHTELITDMDIDLSDGGPAQDRFRQRSPTPKENSKRPDRPRARSPSPNPTPPISVADQTLSSPGLVLPVSQDSNIDRKPPVSRIGSTLPEPSQQQPLRQSFPTSTPEPEPTPTGETRMAEAEANDPRKSQRQSTEGLLRSPDTDVPSHSAGSEVQKQKDELSSPTALAGLRDVTKALAALSPDNPINLEGIPNEAELLTQLSRQYIERYRSWMALANTDLKAASERQARAEFELAEARDTAQRHSTLLENAIRDNREELAKLAEQREADRLQLTREAEERVETAVAHAKAELAVSLAEANAKLAKSEHEIDRRVAQSMEEVRARYLKIIGEADAKVKAAWRTVDTKLAHISEDATEARKRATEFEERYREVELRLTQERRRADEAERARAIAERVASDFEQELRRQEIMAPAMEAMGTVSTMAGSCRL